MKYICIEDEDKNQVIITFPRSINHDVMANGAGRMKNQMHGNWKRITRVVISAGFVDKNGNCTGKSETLNVNSRGDVDTKLLASQYQ